MMMFLTVELMPSTPIRAEAAIYSPELRRTLTSPDYEVAYLTFTPSLNSTPKDTHSSYRIWLSFSLSRQRILYLEMKCYDG